MGRLDGSAGTCDSQPMPITDTSAVELYYESIGDPSDPPMLLIAGLGGQATTWPLEFCNLLADAGFWVIRFDNRDVGLSSKLDDQPVDLSTIIPRALAGQPIDVPYTLSDMALDAIELLDSTGIESAHLVGVSMGGMIAQNAAARHPERVRSLTSIMSSTGSRHAGQPTPAALEVLFERPPPDRDGAITASIRGQRTIGSPVYFDENVARARAEEAYDRSFYPEGVGRQLAAIYAAGNRADLISQIAVPTLVLHGRLDPLIDVSGGIHTAELIPEARLIVFEDMGHDLPQPLWKKIVGRIVEHAGAAEAVR